MNVNPVLIDMLSRKAGCDVTTAQGAHALCNDILAVTGEPVSLNTIKRLTGIISYEKTHRDGTKAVIARYLGFADWSMLQSFLDNKISDFNTNSGFLEMSSLPDGQEVEIEWLPDRKIMIRHLEGCQFEVVSNCNSKLLPGDILNMSQIAVGFPLIVSEVIRDGRSLGNYTAAVTDGITKLHVL